jgi:membrane protease YdiL (CAAX protease family)
MPSLGEELVFRGIYQGQLNDVFHRPWHIFGIQVGCGWILTAVLFAEVHAVHMTSAFRPQVSWPVATGTGCCLLRSEGAPGSGQLE